MKVARSSLCSNPNFTLAKSLASIDDVGESLGLSRTGVIELVQEGHLQDVKIGRRRLITVQSLEAFLDSIGVEPVGA